MGKLFRVIIHKGGDLMLGYILYSKQRKLYITVRKNQYDVTEVPREAKIFNGCTTATKVLTNSISDKYAFAMAPIPITSAPEVMEAKGMTCADAYITDSGTEGVLTPEVPTNPEILYLSSLIKDLYDYISDMDIEKRQLAAKQSELEKTMIDIYHYMEFYDLNAVEGYKIYKKAQEVLRERRKVKEKLTLIETLQKSDISISRFKETIDTLDSLNNNYRQYRPRVLNELFGFVPKDQETDENNNEGEFNNEETD